MKLFRAVQLLAEHTSSPRSRKQHVTFAARTVLQRARISRASHFTALVRQQALAMPLFTLRATRSIRAAGGCRIHDGCHAAQSRNVTGVSLTRGNVVQCWLVIRLRHRIPALNAALASSRRDKPSPLSAITDREWPSIPAFGPSVIRILPRPVYEDLSLVDWNLSLHTSTVLAQSGLDFDF